MECELLLGIKKSAGTLDKKPKPIVGEHHVEAGGMTYNMKTGGLQGNTGRCVVLMSVGDEYPADVVVSQRIKNPSLAKKAKTLFGSLPSIVPSIHEEAVADLIATAKTIEKGSTTSLDQLLLDVPSLQRSKQYYLNQIESHFQNCQEHDGRNCSYMDMWVPSLLCVQINISFTPDVPLVRYMGNSEKDTGNWCFKDGTISFQEIFNMYRRHPSVKCLEIVTDCSYSGQWVRECAKTLDSLHIPPCGHRARENGAMVRLFASCQHNEEAAEPCYSLEASVEEDGSIVMNHHQLTQQTPTYFDSTKLVCCRAPDSPCPKTTFQHLTWENAVDKSISLILAKRIERDREMWYYLLLHQAGDAYHDEFRTQFQSVDQLQLSDWGYILESGEGQDPPQDVTDTVGRRVLVSRTQSTQPTIPTHGILPFLFRTTSFLFRTMTYFTSPRH